MSENQYGFERLCASADRLVMLTGCSGGGKSTLLAELGRRGWLVFEEPGRQIVKEQMLMDGPALPWTDPSAFATLCLSRSLHNIARALQAERRAFFDRGIIDALASFDHAGLAAPDHFIRAAERVRYNPKVFVMPPWPEIFTTDSERRHDLYNAITAYESLVATYRRQGYRIVDMPKTGVAARADFVLDVLSRDGE